MPPTDIHTAMAVDEVLATHTAEDVKDAHVGDLYRWIHQGLGEATDHGYVVDDPPETIVALSAIVKIRNGQCPNYSLDKE
jgi:hypothetical protein